MVGVPAPPPESEHLLVAGAIDTHAHVFHRRLRPAARPRYLPGYDALTPEYCQLLDDHGLAGGVLVQPSFLGTDNAYLLDQLARWPNRLRGVVMLGPESADQLASLARKGVAGVRLNLIGCRTPDLTSAEWHEFGREMARHNVHLEVQARGEQWLQLAPALTAWPGAVVLDHCGLPLTPGLADPSARQVAELARLEHVWIKASAPYRSPDGAAAAMLRRVLDEAGPDRLLWGSDWPWTRFESGRTYGGELRWLAEHLPPRHRRAVLSGNPRRLFGWPDADAP